MRISVQYHFRYICIGVNIVAVFPCESKKTLPFSELHVYSGFSFCMPCSTMTRPDPVLPLQTEHLVF